jgi:cytochrome P450 family 28
MFVVLFISAVLIALYFLKENYEYWKKRGVPGPKPKFIVGNLGQSFLMKKSPFEVFTDIYNQYPDTPIVGVYRSSTPSLIIRDPDFIREITGKSFDHFHENDLRIEKEIDPLIGRNPFFLRGQEWKTVRAQLTPAFTSGKMKLVYPHLEDTSQRISKFIDSQPNATNGQGYEAKELCKRYTLNNVASCAFGLEGKCFEEDNSEFQQIAQQFMTPETWSTVKIFLMSLFPFLTNFISVKFTAKSVEEKVTNIVSQTLRYRERNNVVRNDYLHILMQLKETSKDYDFTDVDVTAHAAGFIADGYESSSVVMSFLLYELANNPDVQSKLRQEIDESFAKHSNTMPYEAIQDMTYLDAVLSESLRMHPATFAVVKRCTKRFTYMPNNTDVISRPVVIEEGTPIIFPSYGLQHDPQYFDDPERFRPERFIGANKDKIKKYTFMPFGEGPRTCLGQRFGVLQIKIGVVYILKNYQLLVNKKTQRPLKYNPMYFLTSPVGGLWIDFKKIK